MKYTFQTHRSWGSTIGKGIARRIECLLPSSRTLYSKDRKIHFGYADNLIIEPESVRLPAGLVSSDLQRSLMTEVVLTK